MNAPGFSPSPWWKRFGAAWLDLVFPPACNACGMSGAGTWPVCKACVEKAPRLRRPRCVRCSREYPESAGADFECANCSGRYFAFAGFSSAYRAEGVVRECVLAFKYHQTRALRHVLGGWLLEALQEPELVGLDFDRIVPVPLHPKKEHKRGYNQALLLAEAVSKSTGIPVAQPLTRVVHTATQTRFDRRRRMENLRNAFAPAKDTSVNALRLLLVDDIFTTGSTMHECARTLIAAGARSVHAAAVARG